MKRLYVLIISLVLIAGLGGFLYYKFWYTDELLNVWDLVPESAIVVYESTNTVENWNEIQAQPVWHNLEQIPFYANLSTRIDMLDSLSGQQGRLDQLLQSKPFVFSIHRISQESLDALFFVQLKEEGDHDVVTKLVSHFKRRDDFNFQSRTYNNFTINEAVNREYQEIFSYLVYKNYFIGSFTPFLVEDVIRKLSGVTQQTFVSSNPQIFQVAKLENDQGNLYINNRKIPQLLSVFASESMGPQLNTLAQLAQSTFLDLKVTEDHIMFNGFTVQEEGQQEYLESVSGSQGGALGFTHLLSNDVSLLYHLTFPDPVRWHGKLTSFWQQNDVRQYSRWEGIKQEYDWDPQGLISVQHQELGLAVMETIAEEQPARMAFVRFSDFNEGLLQLNRVAEIAAERTEDSLYKESFSGREIRQISIPEFPARLWGGLFTGFDQCFMMPMDEYLVISNNIQGLKDLLRAIETEDTWGKSVIKQQWLESSLQEASLSLFVDLGNVWNMLQHRLSPHWKQFLDTHAKAIKRFEWMAIQFSDIGDKFYTSGLITCGRSAPAAPAAGRFLTLQQAYTQSPVVTKPFVVRNHNNGSREVLVQDSLNALYLISSQGRVLWSRPLPGAIRGDIGQIDFYNNGKLQYLLCTDTQMHIIDRNGNPVEGYPVPVPTETRVRHVRAIDYDNSKRYRFICSDESGHVYMFGKEGKPLEGWAPKTMKDQLLFAPQHIRVRGRDCIIALQENGVVDIMNRRGNSYPGFPIDLKEPSDSPLFMEMGTDFSKTFFTTITKTGLIVRFNLLGSVLQKTQLLRPSSDTHYRLCMDPLMRNFVISRQNANRLGILDRRGQVILEKDYLTSGALGVQYYLFGSDHSIYAVTDPVQQFTYLYDQDGILVNSTPIESSQEIALLYFEGQGKHQVYSVYQRQFIISSF